jgi:glycerol uptake facilitator-like aquaporin
VRRDLARKVTAELVGSAFLVATVVGSGVAASRLSPGDAGLQLLENSLATGFVLVALILALHPVSASFNPVVTLIETVLQGLSVATALVLVVAQLVGAILGAIVANLMFSLSATSISTHHRASGAHLLAEVVATLGLCLIVFGSLRSTTGPEAVAISVGGYIAAAYWFTSSTSFANPAVTIGRMLTNTFAGISPASAPAFVGAQVVGGVLGLGLIRFLYVAVNVPQEQA